MRRGKCNSESRESVVNKKLHEMSTMLELADKDYKATIFQYMLKGLKDSHNECTKGETNR